MFKVTSGKKRKSAVWKYFIYDGVAGKSKWSVCNVPLSGKNPTNLKTHLSTYHKAEYKIVEKNDYESKKPSDSANSSTQKLKQFHFQSSNASIDIMLGKGKERKHWTEESNDYQIRLQSLVDVFVSARLLIHLIDNSEFRSFCAVLDPKLQSPRK